MQQRLERNALRFIHHLGHLTNPGLPKSIGCVPNEHLPTDLAELKRIRENIPLQRQRRLDLYDTVQKA